MTITFGGKTAEEAVSAQQQKQFEQERIAGRIRDPLSVPIGETDQHNLSVLGDFTLWTEQRLSEMAALARKRKRLQIKLKDPALEASPHRLDAQRRYDTWHGDIIQYMNEIAELEAQCDRLWQALDPDVRSKYSMDWGTRPHDDRLIGKAWTVKAKAFKWPVGYVITVDGFNRIDPYLRMELNEALGTEPVLLGKEFEW